MLATCSLASHAVSSAILGATMPTISSPPCGLFTNAGKLDRQATQLAYTVKFYPWPELSPAGKSLIAWRRSLMLTKEQIIRDVDEDMVKLTYRGRQYLIVWAYNNIPTEQEWLRKSNKFLVRADFRVSPAIKEGPVVILDFELSRGEKA